VTIFGTNLAGTTTVTFGSTAGTIVAVYGSTAVVAATPAESAGTVHTTVTTYAGTSGTSSADQFTFQTPAAPTVTGVSPSSGTTNGGTSVTITGTNFTNVTGLSFGTLIASYTVNSTTQITATSPAHAAGTVDITVTTIAGTSPTSSSDHYTYTSGGNAPWFFGGGGSGGRAGSGGGGKLTIGGGTGTGGGKSGGGGMGPGFLLAPGSGTSSSNRAGTFPSSEEKEKENENSGRGGAPLGRSRLPGGTLNRQLTPGPARQAGPTGLPQPMVFQVAGWVPQRPSALSPQSVDALMAELAADLLAGNAQRTQAERARTEAFFAQHDAHAVEENSLMEALTPDPFTLAALASLRDL
jgi:hypothetical protein